MKLVSPATREIKYDINKTSQREAIAVMSLIPSRFFIDSTSFDFLTWNFVSGRKSFDFKTFFNKILPPDESYCAFVTTSKANSA